MEIYFQKLSNTKESKDNLFLDSSCANIESQPIQKDPVELKDFERESLDYSRKVCNWANNTSKEIEISFQTYVECLRRNFLDAQTVEMCKRHIQKMKDSDTANPSVYKLNKASFELAISRAESVINESNPKCVASHDQSNSVTVGLQNDSMTPDFFNFYKLLAKMWMGEQVEESDINQVKPCKVLLLRSLVQRKFSEDLSIR